VPSVKLKESISVIAVASTTGGSKVTVTWRGLPRMTTFGATILCNRMPSEKLLVWNISVVVHALANKLWNRLVAIPLMVVVPGRTITVEVDEPSTTYLHVSRSVNGKNGGEMSAHALPAMARRAITRAQWSVLLTMMLLVCMLTLFSCHTKAL
jgi:hypothetical protein